MKKLWKVLIFLFSSILCTAILAVQSVFSNKLKVVACDVGQGDAYLVSYKSTQVIIDGGPGREVLDCVSSNIPFWDRQIELVILTHPQADHYTGLIEIFKVYKVSNLLVNELRSSSVGYSVLVEQVKTNGSRLVYPYNISLIRLGLIQLDILAPKKNFFFSNIAIDASKNQNTISPSKSFDRYSSQLEPNEFSISVMLSFQGFKALFTGDSSKQKCDEIAQILENRNTGPIKYIKVPHHGSKNGLSENLIKAANPDIAVISAGKGNSYGHPHKEVLDMLTKYNLKILRTDIEGEITLETDGKHVWIIN